jgi:hypothetical protein
MNYLSGIINMFKWSENKQPAQDELREYSPAEVTEYYSDDDFKDYMWGVYYKYQPPSSVLDIQLMLIWRLINLGYIEYSHSKLMEIETYEFTGNDIKYKSDIDLFDPRNFEYNTQHAGRTKYYSALYNKVMNICDVFNWETVLDIPDNINTIIVKNNNELTCNIEVVNKLTVKELSILLYKYIVQYWVTIQKISGIRSTTTINGATLTIHVTACKHADNTIYDTLWLDISAFDTYINSIP